MADRNFKYSNNGEFPIRYLVKKRGNDESLKNLNRGFKTFGISEATRKKIAKHCRVLGIAAGTKKVRTSKGEYIQHCSTFITLTLPSDQQHEDAVISKVILGKFLDKCRKLHLMRNYVWRAEKQKSGNIHYHILTDTFANFSLFRRIWYLACRELGYMENYQQKFINMSFAQYQQQPFNKGKTPDKIASAYARGKRSNWSEPPSIQVDFLQDISLTAKYVSKYISKGDPDNPNIVTGRTWGASQSVSAAVDKFTHDTEFNKHWYSTGSELMNRKVIEREYFQICLFNFSSLSAWFRETAGYIRNLLSSVFSPCNYYLNSLGLFPSPA